MTNQKSSGRRKRLAIFMLSLITIGVLGIIAWGLLGGSRLEKRLAKLRAEGQPTSLAELEPAEEHKLRRLSLKIPPKPSKEKSNRDSNAIIAQQLEELGAYKQLARSLSQQMKVAISDGEIEAASELGIELFKLSNYVQNESFVTSYLTSIPIRGMAIEGLNEIVRDISLSNESRNILNACLTTHDTLVSFQDNLVTERVLGIESMREQRAGLVAILAGLQSTSWQLDLLDMYEQVLPIVSQPWCLGNDDLIKLEQENGYSAIIQLSYSYIRDTYIAANRDLASERCLRVLNELVRYKVVNGKEANGLSDLSLTSKQCLDPFSGKPLLLKLTQKGWIVYSVFENGKDDGGQCDDGQLDWGLAP